LKAVKITGIGKVEVQEVHKPSVGSGQVLIKMKASCLCRSDLYRYHGEVLFKEAGMGENWTPGHEPCGVVEEIGPNVTSVKPGDRVGIYMMLGCEKCDYCIKGYVMLCDHFGSNGLGCIGFVADGAHADYLITTEKNCLPLPENMDFVVGALLTDMGGTLYSACKKLNVNGRMTVAVFGAGPMGCAGVMFARAFGAKTVIIDPDNKRLSFAESIGADVALNPKACDVVEKIHQLTNGRGADAAIDCSGNPQAENNAIDCIKKLGSMCIVGENDACTVNPSVQFIRKLITLHASWIFNRQDWMEMCRFVLENDMPIEKIATHKFYIEDAAKAFRLFDRHEAQKVVFVWDN